MSKGDFYRALALPFFNKKGNAYSEAPPQYFLNIFYNSLLRLNRNQPKYKPRFFNPHI
jgi:hypothetical protein